MTVYSDEMVNKICHRISHGKSLAATCRELNIDDGTVYNWLKDESKASFIDKYARARELQSHLYADEIIEIADNETIPTDSRRIRIDARRWHAGKNNSKYGDKQSVEVNHKGAIGLESADLSGLCGLLTQLATKRANPEIQGDVSDRPVLPAPVRPG